MRRIGVITTSRADYGLYRPILRRITADPELELLLIVGGMHLSPEFGSTVRVIEQDGFEIAEKIEMLLSSDTPEGISKSMGLAMIGFAQCFTRLRPEIILVLGDRFEMFAAAAAAAPFNIPIAHIHGGEVTRGAIDEAFRHSLTKMSHLHFATTEEYARRIRQMGEEDWRVTVSGAPSLDNLREIPLLSPEELNARYGLEPTPDTLLVTYHPVTLQYEKTEWQMGQLLLAIKNTNLPVIFTMPNADTGGRIIGGMIEKFLRDYPQGQAVDNLGSQAYFSVMSRAGVMVGNSSSGIIEAASFELPVVNVGNRQTGRVHGLNVIDVGNDFREITEGLKRALDPGFRKQLRGMANPYRAREDASKVIVDGLKGATLGEGLLLKRFRDMEPE